MKRVGLLVLLCVLSTNPYLSAQVSKQNLVILPLYSKADTAAYNKASVETTKDLIFNSLYNFIAILPFVNSPESAVLQRIDSSKNSMESLSKKYDADYIVHGDVDFKGESSDPAAVITLKVWSRAAKETIFEKKYTSAIDLDIFDTMDRLIIDTIQASFKIVPRFAVVNFQDFKIRDDSYTILVNNKELAVADNKDFSKSLKILADNEYNIMLIRDRDQAIMLNMLTTLKENSVQNVSYKATATVRIEKIKGKPDEKYNILFNGRLVQENTTLSNLDATREHSILVTDSKNRIFDKQQFMLRDSEVKSIRPGKLALKANLRLFAGGNSYGGLGVDLTINKKLWLGLEASYLYASSPVTNASFSIFQANMDLGYDFLKLSDLTIGAGLGGGYYFTSPIDQWQLISGDPAQGLQFRAFAQLDWMLFYGRAGVSYNLAQGAPGAYVVLGLRL